MKKKIKAFTMIEVLIITVMVGIGFLSIVIAVNKAKDITKNITQEIIANQLAIEGIEMIHQIRNTNIIRNPSSGDICRLNINPYEHCDGNNDRFGTGNYIIISGNIVTGTNESLILSGGISTGDKNFALCLSGGQWISCPGKDNQTKYGKFFRTIQGIGLYDKDQSITGGNQLNCPNGNTGNCLDNTAKEYRFCSRVEYIGTEIKKTEICSILTNFFD